MGGEDPLFETMEQVAVIAEGSAAGFRRLRRHLTESEKRIAQLEQACTELSELLRKQKESNR